MTGPAKAEAAADASPGGGVAGRGGERVRGAGPTAGPGPAGAPDAAGARAAAGRPMRLLYLNQHPQFGSGSSNQLLQLVRELVRRGHEVTVSAPRPSGPVPPELDLARFEEDAGARLVRLPPLAKRPRLDTLRALRRLVREGRYDALHAIRGRSLDHLFLATLGLRRCPPLVHTHGMQYPLDMFNSIKFRSRRVKRIIAVTEFVKQMMVRTGRIDPRKIEVVYQSAELERFDPARVDGAGVREEFGIPAGAPLVGIVANLGAYKRYDLFVDMAAKVRHQVPEAWFLSVGGGDATPYVEQARELGIADRIVFAGYRADVPRLIAAMDVTVNTSWNEALGTSRIESLAMGVPTVSFDGGGSPEVVRDGVTGFLAPFPDTRAFAAHVAALLRDAALREAMGRAAREDALRRFSLEAKADAYERIYHGLGAWVSTVAS
ncbi:MAG TPA: glycosyltransferase family 4 protein [Longimicrobiales bacterium]